MNIKEPPCYETMESVQEKLSKANRRIAELEQERAICSIAIDPVEITLEARKSKYGDYLNGTSATAQAIKEAMHGAPNWRAGKLATDMRESLDMIANKIARILSGDFEYADSWHDVAGYAKLVEQRLTGKS